MRISGVNHQRDPHCTKTAPRQLGSMLGRGGGHARAHHMREIHTPLLNHVALCQYTADATPTLGSIP